MTTFVSLLLDETGSMAAILDDTLGGVNTYVKTLRESDEADNIKFTLVKFDSRGYRPLVEKADLVDVPELTTENYQPGAMTPLIDATMDIITRTEEQVNAKKNPDKHKVVVVVQTDGQENASRRFKVSDLKEKINELKAKDWQVVFIGADLDAFAEASQYGVTKGSTMSYSPDRSMDAFVGLASNTVGYASGQNANMDWSDDQRGASGEDDVLARKRRKREDKAYVGASRNAS